MTVSESAPASTRRSAGTTSGYVVAIVVNAILLALVSGDALWRWLTFVTDDIDRVLPLIQLSLVAAIAANVAYLIYDARWFKSLTQIGVLGINVLATARMLEVFPFDFPADGIAWATITRVVLIMALIGTGIAVVVEIVRLAGALLRA
jgi:hypothetical protein